MNSKHFGTSEVAARVESSLRLPDETTSRPVLILVSGLPGTGKSFLGRQIAQALPVAVVETDFVRKTLFRRPTYSPEESSYVYRVCHALLKSLLSRGFRVIFDGTNLLESGREILYRLADEVGAKLIVVRTLAPDDVVRGRLRARTIRRAPGDLSDADESVYDRMKRTEQPIRRRHLVVDTSKDFSAAVAKIVREARKR